MTFRSIGSKIRPPQYASTKPAPRDVHTEIPSEFRPASLELVACKEETHYLERSYRVKKDIVPEPTSRRRTIRVVTHTRKC